MCACASISYALFWLYDFCLTTSYTNLAVVKIGSSVTQAGKDSCSTGNLLVSAFDLRHIAKTDLEEQFYNEVREKGNVIGTLLALPCSRLLASGESESNKIGWRLERDGTHFSLLARFLVSHQPSHGFRAFFFSIRASLSVSHKTGYATRQDEKNPLFWLAAPRDWH